LPPRAFHVYLLEGKARGANPQNVITNQNTTKLTPMIRNLLLLSLVTSLAIACGDNNTSASDDSVATNNNDKSNNESSNNTTMSTTPSAPKVFYMNYDTNEGIEDPVEMTEEEAIKILKELPTTDGNFMGMSLSNDEVVQFMHQDGRGLVLDIPMVAEPVDKVITLDQAVQVIKDAYSGKSAEDIALANH
jgi:hypothetical protein